ncbi:MAG: serine/threonine protein kinase [Planctomycetota bacterium]|nr:serine/threonine protein kinase [Planctomycetota bacterium]
MNELLKLGQVVQTKISGQPCQVEKFLGGGGQGEVYAAKWTGGSFALKWYFPHAVSDEQRDSLEKLIHETPPSDAFLWPLDIADAPGVAGFGYLMRLRDQRFKGLLDLMMNRIDPQFRELVTVGLALADNFFKLHAKGLCYRDISFGNAFFDPDTGEVLICDNDNVTENRSPRVSVLGTPDFMAPEIVRGESLPSRQTDLFSLAVLLFYIFHVHHPLVGRKILSIRCWDLVARTKLQGHEPIFIFDPSDKSNEAVRDPSGEAGANALTYWPIYPQFLRDTFVKAFTDGIRDPEHGRVMEGEWRQVLSRLRDSIYFCPRCGNENFYDADAVQTSGGKPAICWEAKCKKELRLPYHFCIGKSIVMLTHIGKLYPHHLDSSKDFDFTKPVAEVVQHPTDLSVWGLKNLTQEKWVATMADGSLKDVEPGRSVPLGLKVKVNFGKAEGEIRY